MTAPTAFRMDIVETVTGVRYEQVALLQARSMATLALVSAHNHVFVDVQLAELCRNPRVVKVLVFEGEELVGFGAASDDPDAVLEFNGDYFRKLYPAEAERRTLWYAVAGIVDPRHWRSGILTRMGDELAAILHQHGAEVLLWDAVDVRFEMMSAWVDQVVSARFRGEVQHTQIDSHRWMATRLPAPTDGIVIDLTGESSGGPTISSEG